MKKELNLSDVVDYFKKNQIPSFEEEIDQYGSYLITAARLAAVILAPNPVTAVTVFCSGIDAASLRVSKLVSWLPDKFKYGKKGREKFAIERYELSSVINFKLLDIAILNSLKDVIMPFLADLLKDISLDENDKREIERISDEAEKAQQKINLDTFSKLDKDDIAVFAMKVIEPFFPYLLNLLDKCGKKRKKSQDQQDIDKLYKLYLDKTYILYNAFLINLSSEFPEFCLWCDITQKDLIKKELTEIKKQVQHEGDASLNKIHKTFSDSINELLKKIESLRENEFSEREGFPTFEKNYIELFEKQTENIFEKLDERVKENIDAHQNKIKEEIEKPLSDNDDIEEIIYPKNKEIYIAQSFQTIVYKRKSHRKGFLTSDSLADTGAVGEDIGKYLLQKLVDPNTAFRPIIILGNPGAGKSMFSKMFAAQLCETSDYIPFLIRLRDVASSSSNISEHINKGIAHSIKNTEDINWIEWAKLFRDRIPVIILDGFDELMQSSDTELNGYINSIKDLQETALHHKICLRVILTSRITVMQDVSIPDGTDIVKLDVFDEKRKALWVSKWNSYQTKENYQFSVPANEKINELAKEPLLLFMLAVYDFPQSDLQKLSEDTLFNQSRLYDSLLNSFAERQLKKYPAYLDANPEVKKEEEDLFRMRLGMIALMMFLNDTTSKDTQKLSDELAAFKLHNSKIQSSNVLGGFFFIHENKSTTEGELERYNYEFLHKSFGEFLAADFLLRIASRQKTKATRDKEIFKFCFGYNWLHKHNEIQKYLFEHANQIIAPGSEVANYVIEEIITQDLENLFDKVIQEFPVSEIRVIEHKYKIEHIAIYSQNIMFLWAALSIENESVKFEIFQSSETHSSIPADIKYNTQDREEFNKNKLLWKRISSLWSLFGNYNATAKLLEWVDIYEDQVISFKKRLNKIEIKHNFSNAALVTCNDFNFIISIFDNEFKFNKEDSVLNKVMSILKIKPEFAVLANDALLHRFGDLEGFYGRTFTDYLIDNNLSPRQLADFIDQFLKYEHRIPNKFKRKLTHKIIEELIKHGGGDSSSLLKLIKYTKPFDIASPFYNLIDSRMFEELFERLVIRSRHDRENSQYSLEYLQVINELSEAYFFDRIINPKIIEHWIYQLNDELQYFDSKNAYLVLEYLKLINKLNAKYYFQNFSFSKKYLGPEIIEKAFKRLLVGIDHEYRENPQYLIEYLRLVNELIQLNPKGKITFHQIGAMEEVIDRFLRDLPHISRENPHLALEFIRFLHKADKKYWVLKNLNLTFITDLIEMLFREMTHEHRGLFIKEYYEYRENPQYPIEYLRLVNELIQLNPKGKITFHQIGAMEEVIDRFLRDLPPISRRNPHLALEFLKLWRNINKDSPVKKFYPEMLEDVLERLVKRLPTNSQDHEFTIQYLQLLSEIKESLSIQTNFNSKFLEQLIHKLSRSFQRLAKENTQLALQYLKLFIKFDDKIDLSKLLTPFPDLNRLYKNNSEQFVIHLEALANFMNYEERY